MIHTVDSQTLGRRIVDHCGSNRGTKLLDHCEKNRRVFSQWSVAIKSKITSRYDMGNDHCEKNVRVTPDFSQRGRAAVKTIEKNAVPLSGERGGTRRNPGAFLAVRDANPNEIISKDA
jgi:hypothetical protein